MVVLRFVKALRAQHAGMLQRPAGSLDGLSAVGRRSGAVQRWSSSADRPTAPQEGKADEEFATEEQVQRILDAGTTSLFDSEEGKEQLREAGYAPGETAKVVLEAAKEVMEKENGEESRVDAEKAKGAAEEIEKGFEEGGVAKRVKERVTGLGHTG